MSEWLFRMFLAIFAGGVLLEEQRYTYRLLVVRRHPFGERYMAMAFGRFVALPQPWYSAAPYDQRVEDGLRHEAIHVEQAQRYGLLMWCLRYVAGCITGIRRGHWYRRNPLEIEAVLRSGSPWDWARELISEGYSATQH